MLLHAHGPISPDDLCLYSLEDCIRLHSFPTRRSSDLLTSIRWTSPPSATGAKGGATTCPRSPTRKRSLTFGSKDRKSTRLNSSHANTSYAVFCLKKKC